jgi:WD40 repeat protein
MYMCRATLVTAKRTVSLVFSNDTNQSDGSDLIILADKSGQVLAWNTAQPTASTSTTPETEADADDDDDDKLPLLLGHCSILTDMALVHRKSQLITSDRDEKIRVSAYPNTYNITSFLLGHTDYVAGFQSIDDETLGPLIVSGGGDGTLRLWNYLEGSELQCIQLTQV